jgi:hypothetical protein
MGKVPGKAPGTGLASLLPHLRQDAKQQKLEAAAEAFSDSISMAEEAPVHTQKLVLQGPGKAQLQSLEQVSKQCSTFLDCLAMQSTIVPQYTHPTYGAEDDRIVRTEAQSLSHTAMHDAFNPKLRPWRLISKWPFEADDLKVKMPTSYIGAIARPSYRSGKSHMKYDVQAAGFPSSTRQSMYAKERRVLKGQALAAEKDGTLAELMNLWEEPPSSSRQKQLKMQSLEALDNPLLPESLGFDAPNKPQPKDNLVKPGARGLGVRNYENTVGVCGKGVNCDSSNSPFGEQDSMSDALVDAQVVRNSGMGEVGPWTPLMYSGNKPTTYDPGAAYIPDYQFLSDHMYYANPRRRTAGFPFAKSQMLLQQQQQQQQIMTEEMEAADVAEPQVDTESSEPMESESSEPLTESSEPLIESSEPLMETSEPLIETESSEPLMETESSEPLTDSSEPVMETESSEPLMETESSEPLMETESSDEPPMDVMVCASFPPLLFTISFESCF